MGVGFGVRVSGGWELAVCFVVLVFLWFCLFVLKKTLSSGQKDFSFFWPHHRPNTANEYPTWLVSTACLPTDGWQLSILPLWDLCLLQLHVFTHPHPFSSDRALYFKSYPHLFLTTVFLHPKKEEPELRAASSQEVKIREQNTGWR